MTPRTHAEPELNEDISIRLEGKKYTQKWISYDKYIEKVAELKAERDMLRKDNVDIKKRAFNIIKEMKAELAEKDNEIMQMLTPNDVSINYIPKAKVQEILKHIDACRRTGDYSDIGYAIYQLEELLSSGKEKP